MRGGQFHLLLITPEGAYPEEVSWLHKLFEAGLTCLHLRKPGWSQKQLFHFASQIDAAYHPRMMVHYEDSLLEEAAFRGVHYRMKALPAQKPAFTVSCGLHSWQELRELDKRLDYAFVSPFFSSISKKGYSANRELWNIPAGSKKEKAIALGGINVANLAKVHSAGLGGAAVLGSVWEGGNPLLAYLKLTEQLKKIAQECPKQDLL